MIATVFRDAVEVYPPLRGPGAGLLEATKNAGCISVQLTYDRRTNNEPFLVMVPTASSPQVGTLFLEHVKAPDRAPAGASLITAFIPTLADTAFSSSSDDGLIGVWDPRLPSEECKRVAESMAGSWRRSKRQAASFGA